MVGERDENPSGLGLLQLLVEDFRAHDSRLASPGFLAVAVHRLGNARMRIGSRAIRLPFSLAYKVAHTSVNWFFGIDLPYTVQLGRRVRIWHHGGIVLNARSIGDDVHIRHNTTFGVAHRGKDDEIPTIGNGCDIGVGACVLGSIEVGECSVVGANSVVLDNVRAGSTVVGAPARDARRLRVV